ncbi:MAG: hydroxymethylbilane synthase [Thermaerobacter sp.]|nr:hydroxymethylbilane synthase [Thermaerobacter sp.]
MMEIRIASRRSPLARAQAELAAKTLHERYAHLDISFITIETEGDRRQSAPLVEIGGKGVFTQEIEQMLRRDEADLAVHSLKDLPTTLPRGLRIVAALPREDPRDVLVTRDGKRLRDLPPGACIGTSSPRRQAQLRLWRPDLRVEGVRGNVGTRLRKLGEGEVDGLVMAAAGLLRAGEGSRIAEYLDPEEMLPAPAQGVIAFEARSARKDLRDFLRAISDRAARRASSAERAFLAGLGSGCAVPIGALAEVQGRTIRLRAGVFATDGSAALRTEVVGTRAEEVGKEAALALLRMGAERLLRDVT